MTQCKNGHDMTVENTYTYAHYTQCLTCKAEAAQRYRENNRQERRDRSNTDHQRKKRALVEYKGDKCLDCGVSYPDCVYDFEHRDPFQKSYNIGAKLHRPLEELKQEADKCDLLCSNCHRIRSVSPLVSERKKLGWVKRKEREASQHDSSTNLFS